MKNPMDKNGLGKPLPSRNDHINGPKTMTTASGAPVVNNEDTMTAGERGPQVLQDFYLLEKHAHFNREVIPERRMHAKGSGAFGTFTVTHDITQYTKAKIFSEIGKKTEMFARFSTVAGERGAADAERDIRGFAVKFYTEDGNWDIVGNNTPVFFFRDPKKFIDLNHAVKRDPRTNLRSPNTNWDFWTSLPESLLQVTITMSDRGIPSSFRYMHGFGSHTYSLINDKNERVWVKFHHRSVQGIQNFTDQEAEMVVGKDRESSGRDLYEAIEKGMYPKWKFYIQVMTEEQAKDCPFNPFDLTKMWPKKAYPLIEVGEWELNRNADNFYQDVEQAAFTPANIVPGIGFSPDRMLQTRIFAYGDAQRYRLGVNHHQIPVNSPKGVKHPHSFHRDGQMRVDGNLGSELHYAPNSYGDWNDHPDMAEPPMEGGNADYYDFRKDDHDYFTQPGELFRAMTDAQQLVLVENTARAMEDATLQIKHRHIRNCHQADESYGTMLAAALGIDIDTVDLTEASYDSRAQWEKDRHRDADLDQPTEAAEPETAKDLPAEGRDTNVSDPASLTDWQADPYLL
ncbi:catalase [Peptoniphilus equinus]|uniref:Catalase n=2 Tax=Peptoniphilus equinus TaxID=3016343 RepID=A0ABY7QWL3_9FIRM|nr:catalase [Peptoniphilus equinus]WBW50489.1 catalase [Peptoniphilus equinus]